MRALRGFLVTVLLFGALAIHAADIPYATPEFWNQFWKNPSGWGKPNDRVMELISELDGTKETISIVDIGSGNGRHSVQALEHVFASKKPKSSYTVFCMDVSEVALKELSERPLPPWLKLSTRKAEVNAHLLYKTTPKADLFLLYGILEYVEDWKLPQVLSVAQDALYPNGYLVVTTLVSGEAALEIENERIRSEDEYRSELNKLNDLYFANLPTVTLRPDFHDLGKGYPEHHLHYVFRTVLKKRDPEHYKCREQDDGTMTCLKF